jgi:hypothetical protein
MNRTWFTILACVAVLVGAFVAGRMSVPETTTTVPADVKIEPLKDIVVAGEADSTSLKKLIDENVDLRALVSRLKATAAYRKWQTSYYPPDSSGREVEITPEQKVATWSMDTTKPVTVEVATISGEDTLRSSATTSMNVHAIFMGNPLNAFWLVNASVDPFEIHRSVTERSRGDDDWGTFSFRAIGAGGGGVGLGGQFELGRIGAGVLFVSDTKPLYLVSCKIFQF